MKRTSSSCWATVSILDPKGIASLTNWKMESASVSAGVHCGVLESSVLAMPLATLAVGCVEAGSYCLSTAGGGCLSVCFARAPVTLMMVPSCRERISVDCTFGRRDRLSSVVVTVAGSLED